MTPVTTPHSGPSQGSRAGATRQVGKNSPLKAYSNNAAPKARTTPLPPSMPSHNMPNPVPQTIPNCMGHKRWIKARN